ncbi:MAG: hypothetical protein E7412_00450 [Ruminococcaceae bacterium]|nr:hypothetical protein [Oscillospiraceae bacterium]
MKKICSITLVLSMILAMLTGVVSVSAANEDIILIDEDFSTGFELDKAYTAAEMEALSEDLNFATGVPANHWPDKTNAYFKVKQIDANDASKGNYLEISSQKDDSHAIVMGDFADITTGAFVVEMKMRPQVGRRTKLYNGVVGADQSVKYTLYGVNSSDAVVWSYGIFPSWQKQLTPGEDDFCSVKTVWSRANAASNWSVDMYDMVTNQLLLSYTTGGENTLDSSFIPSAIMFYNNWQVAADSEVSVDIASLKAYIPATISLTANGAYDPGKKSISFTTSEALDAATVTSETVTVTNSAGEAVAATPSYENGVIKVTTDARLTSGTYTISVNGAKKSSDGMPVFGANCTFVVERVGDIVLVDEDFSTGFELDRAYTAAEMEALSEDLIFTTGDWMDDLATKYYAVKQMDENDASKGNYLEIGIPLSDNAALVRADFDDVEKGTLVMEMKIRQHIGRRFKMYNGLIGADGSTKHTLTGINGSDEGLWTGGIFKDNTNGGSILSVGDDEFSSIKVIWNRATTEDNWSVDLYDMVTNNLVMSYTGDGSQTIDKTFTPSKAEFFWNYYMTGNSQVDVKVDIADLKVYIPSLEQENALENAVFVSGGQPIDALSANMTDLSATVDVKTEKANQAYAVVLAVYNGDRLVGVDVADGTTDANGVAEDVALSLTNLVLETGANAKLFLWDGMTSLIPLAGVPEVLPTAGF